MDQWMVVVSGHKLVEEMRRRPDDELSFTEAIESVCRIIITSPIDTSTDFSFYKILDHACQADYRQGDF